MALDRPIFVTVHQCLFGYDDGHRLLAASTKLPFETSSLLLLLSDLAPGVSPGEGLGYWTGMPILGAKRFALLQTWPAPEMSRPGCVWTHALLIDFADLNRIPDLNIVRNLMARPNRATGYAEYTKPLSCSLDSNAIKPVLSTKDSDLLALVRAVYGLRAIGTVAAQPGTLDDAVFALWSQQWPRLRRSFAFRTATTSLELSTSGVRFHLGIIPQSHPQQGESSSAKPWEVAVLADLKGSEPTEFRRFIARYGPDLRRGRQRFRHLAQLYSETRVPVLSGSKLESILWTLTKAFSQAQDAHGLKEALVTAGETASSLLPKRDPIEILTFFVRHGPVPALPDPPQQTLDAMWKQWPEQAHQILALGDEAALKPSELGGRIITRLAATIDQKSVLVATREFPHLRRELIQRNTGALDSDDLLAVPGHELLELLELVPSDAPAVAPLLERLTAIDDAQLVRKLWDKFPDHTLRAVAASIERAASEGLPLPACAWRDLITLNRDIFIRGRFIESSRSTRALATLAALLLFDSHEVLQVGPEPWAKALRHAEDNVTGRDRQFFLAFILGMALRQPRRGCEILMERSFEPLHRDLAESSLPDGAFHLFSSQLPSTPFWWEWWDSCLRLRMAVVEAYVEYGLEPSSFRHLTKTDWLFGKLTALAAQTRRGRKFLKKVPSDAG